jgi:CelD/BcsL family acetyltransferase involved in cellulose biosynthesis
MKDYQCLKSVWNSMVDEMRPSPFLRHEWFQYWIESYANSKHIFILVFREGTNAIGIAPLQKKFVLHRGFPIRKISFLENSNSPLCDIIAHPERSSDVARALFDSLDRTSWDMVDLGHLPENSSLVALFNETKGTEDYRGELVPHHLSPVLRITGHLEDYINTRSRRFRKSTRNNFNKTKTFEKVEVLRITDREVLRKNMEYLEEISRNSPRWRNGTSIFDNKGNRSFFDRLSQRCSYWDFSVWMLLFDGKPVAYEYHLESDHVAYGMKCAYNKYYKDYSPGSILDYNVVKNYFQSGCKEYDLGQGCQDYKLNWTRDTKNYYRVVLFNNGLYSQSLRFLDSRIIPLMKNKLGKSSSSVEKSHSN